MQVVLSVRAAPFWQNLLIMRYFILLVKEKLPITFQEAEMVNYFEENYDRKIIPVQDFSDTLDDLLSKASDINLEYPSHSAIKTELFEQENEVFLKFGGGNLFTLVFYSEKV
jgi:hypothetical protein